MDRNVCDNLSYFWHPLLTEYILNTSDSLITPLRSGEELRIFMKKLYVFHEIYNFYIKFVTLIFNF